MAKTKAKPATGAGEKTKPEMSADAPKTDKPKTGKKSKAKYVGQELTIKLSSGKEYTGFCTAERKTNDGDQVFLKIAGAVSRFFNAKDIAK